MSRPHLDTGDRCVYCGESTSFGSGRFVNRLAVGTSSDLVEWLAPDIKAMQLDVWGWGCAECSGFECDSCGKQIYLDEDVPDANDEGHYHESCVPVWPPS